MTNTTAGLALRSTDRATPVVFLALAMLLGSALAALWRRLSIVGITTALLVAGLVVANNPSVFNGDTIANAFTQPDSLPSYQLAAIYAPERDPSRDTGVRHPRQRLRQSTAGATPSTRPRPRC